MAGNIKKRVHARFFTTITLAIYIKKKKTIKHTRFKSTNRVSGVRQKRIFRGPAACVNPLRKVATAMDRLESYIQSMTPLFLLPWTTGGHQRRYPRGRRLLASSDNIFNVRDLQVVQEFPTITYTRCFSFDNACR